MAPAVSVLAVAASAVGQPGSGKVDPAAPCQDQSDDACCYGNKTAAVVGGVDFVDLALNKKQGVDAPALGSARYTAQLNGYTFRFVSQANADTFAADPWTYAPACGGFWGYGVGEESSPPSRIALPSVTITEGYWIRYNNRTYMEKGQGPYQMMLAEIDDAVQKIDANWAIKFGSDKSKWPFDTQCCATPTYRKMAQCIAYPPMGGCYLKYSADGQAAKAGATACTVNAAGKCDCKAGYDIQNSGGGSSQQAATQGDCCSACAADAQCKVAVFVAPS